ncbi:MAG TPA: antitoxin [Acetobacteraceae bacterium]|jgi:uncharacterized protein (DUF4415 family)|nr:antitoxin [Acetobacteraceae bacterium]
MSNKKDDKTPRPDETNPEWTCEDVRDARPVAEVFAEVFGPEAGEMVKRGRGRPTKTDKKINQTLRLDVDLLEAYRRSGSGWQARINQVLREHMPTQEH